MRTKTGIKDPLQGVTAHTEQCQSVNGELRSELTASSQLHVSMSV